jgi:DNA-binding protein YbaB
MRASDIERIWDQVATISETALSADGCVETTVDARGRVLALKLDPRVLRRLDSTALADTIVATISEAAQLAQRRAFDSMAPLLPRNASPEHTDLAIDPIMHHLTEGASHG